MMMIDGLQNSTSAAGTSTVSCINAWSSLRFGVQTSECRYMEIEGDRVRFLSKSLTIDRALAQYLSPHICSGSPPKSLRVTSRVIVIQKFAVPPLRSRSQDLLSCC